MRITFSLVVVRQHSEVDHQLVAPQGLQEGTMIYILGIASAGSAKPKCRYPMEVGLLYKLKAIGLKSEVKEIN